MSFVGQNLRQNTKAATQPEQEEAPGASERHSAVHDLQRQLEEELKRPPVLEPGVADVGSEDAAKPDGVPPAKSRTPARIIKALLGVAIVVVFGWTPLRAFLQPSSVEAIVNSRVVTVRAPIAGEVIAEPSTFAESGVLAAGQTILRIVNPRADRARLDALRDDLARLQIRRTAQDAKIASVGRAYDELARSAARYGLGRVAQLEAREKALEAALAAANARREVAVAEADRAESLVRSGAISAADAHQRMGDRTVAEQEAVAAERALDANRAELEAARQGSFIGDGYSDRPSSEQRRNELGLQLEELNAERDATDAEIARLQDEIANETSRYEANADVAIALPVTGRIWEAMVAPGEYVRVGQDLLKVLDCSGAVVTANVTESVYNGLSVGAPALFRPTDGGADLKGTVVNLTGLAEAAANLAIRPSDLDREAYRVTVRVPDLATGRDCGIGRTGRVIFGKGSADAI